MEKLNFTTSKRDKIANILCEKGFSFQSVNKLLRNKDIRIDGVKIKENIAVERDSEITVFYDSSMLKMTEFDRVYEDDNIIIVNKPCGIEIEGENGLARRLSALPVHRLDRNTTGLVVLCKNRESEEAMLKAFAQRTIQKKYLAEVVGESGYKNYHFKAFLTKDASKSLVKISLTRVKNSVPIETIFNTLKSSPSSSLIEASLVTGKTHQIRASLSFLGHPIIGDGKYGRNEDNKKFKSKSQRLHSYYIKFENISPPLDYLNNKSFIRLPAFANVDNLPANVDNCGQNVDN